MRILSRHYIARFLGLFVTTLTAALILLATVELVLNLDDLSSFGSEAAPAENPIRRGIEALHFLWVRLASYYLPDLIPIASFAAAFITFAWAGRAMELVAIQAGGIRLGRIVYPVLATALILSLASALAHETVILHAKQVWNARVRGTGDAIDFGRLSFWYHKGRIITNITKADATTRTLYGVEIFERGPEGRIVRVVRAARVHIDEEGLWKIEQARIWTFDPGSPTTPPGLTQDVSLVLDLDSLGGSALLGAEPQMLSLPSLARYLAAQSKTSSSTHRRLSNLYHERLNQPWLVLLFAFLALPFGLRVDATGRIVPPAIAAVVVVGLYFFVRSAGITLAQQDILPTGSTQWVSMALFTVVTALALRRFSL